MKNSNNYDLDVCPNCGRELLGDGYTEIKHCEFAKEEDYFDHEHDANPVYCKEIW
jgi:uncharacterized protein (DUF983 family)